MERQNGISLIKSLFFINREVEHLKMFVCYGDNTWYSLHGGSGGILTIFFWLNFIYAIYILKSIQ